MGRWSVRLIYGSVIYEINGACETVSQSCRSCAVLSVWADMYIHTYIYTYLMIDKILDLKDNTCCTVNKYTSTI